MENLALKDIELDEYLKTVGGACIENDVRIQEVEIDKNSSDFSDADLSDISLPDVEVSKPKTGNDLRQHRKKINEDRSVKKPLIIEDTKCYSSSALDLNSFDSMSTTVTSTTMEFKQLKL